MKKELFKATNSLVTSIIVIIATVILFAPEIVVNAGEGVIVIGVVETISMDTGDITSVKLDLRPETDEIFNVVLNAAGIKLGKEMNGSLVEVIGSVRIEDDVNWLEVKRYEKVYFSE